MRRIYNSVCTILMTVCCTAAAFAQPAAKSTTAVPRLVRFSGALTDSGGKTLSGVVGVTFALYEEQEGGSPIWMETQNVQADASGKYTAMLGATRNDGIPAEIFGSGNRWLDVQIQSVQGESERPRVLLVSVPYALKSVDAETLGGLPASAYALAAPSKSEGPASAGSANSGPKAAAVTPNVSGSGTTEYIPLWTSSTALATSSLYQNSAGNVGVGTTVPMAKLEAVYGGGAFIYAALAGDATAPTGGTFGVYGSSDSTDGTGVRGEATAASGATFGMSGIAESTTGVGLLGKAPAASGKNFGLQGISASTQGVGVQGSASATTGDTFGVYGLTSSTSGTGVKGVGVAVSDEGGEAPAGAAGIWGDTSTGAEAILATADNTEAIGAYSKSNSQATVYAENASTESDAIVLATFGPEFAGYCDTFTNGNLMCSGSVGGHAVVNQSRDVALYSVQAAENWMEDAGSGQLQNGAAVIELEPEFAQTVNTGLDYHVFLTPRGDCKGLYVGRTTPTSFEVHELGGGTANIAFDYRVMARRKGFENIRLADMTGKIQMRPNSKSGNGVRPGVASKTPATR